jgi:hypothetical protein
MENKTFHIRIEPWEKIVELQKENKETNIKNTASYQVTMKWLPLIIIMVTMIILGEIHIQDLSEEIYCGIKFLEIELIAGAVMFGSLALLLKIMSLYMDRYIQKLRESNVINEIIIDTDRKEITYNEQNPGSELWYQTKKIRGIKEVLWDEKEYTILLKCAPILIEEYFKDKLWSRYEVTYENYYISSEYKYTEKMLNCLKEISLSNKIEEADSTEFVKEKYPSKTLKCSLHVYNRCHLGNQNKCKLCNLKDACTSKDKGKNKECTYWRCKFKDGDRCCPN